MSQSGFLKTANLQTLSLTWPQADFGIPSLRAGEFVCEYNLDSVLSVSQGMWGSERVATVLS